MNWIDICGYVIKKKMYFYSFLWKINVHYQFPNSCRKKNLITNSLTLVSRIHNLKKKDVKRFAMHAVLIHNSVLIYEIKKIAVLKKILNDGHLCLVTLELNSDRLLIQTYWDMTTALCDKINVILYVVRNIVLLPLKSSDMPRP